MPQKSLMIALITGLFLFPAAIAGDVQTAPAPGPGYGPGYGMMRGGCPMIMRTLTPEQHAMHFHDMQAKMNTLTVTKFRAWRTAECAKLNTPAARDAYAKDLQARWDKLSDKEKLSVYHEMLAWRQTMGPRNGGRGMGPGNGRGMGWK